MMFICSYKYRLVHVCMYAHVCAVMYMCSCDICAYMHVHMCVVKMESSVIAAQKHFVRQGLTGSLSGLEIVK